MATIIDNPPSAYVLMDSMRNIGYSFNSAIADIVDNSISAGAKRIDICVPANPEDVYLAIIDDGAGMDAEALRVAMRYGSKSKNEKRADQDLGRYGLGLKSASLSQCRRLTVISKTNGVYSGACWDLDQVEKTERWSLIELNQEEIRSCPCIDKLGSKTQGTLVLWRDFDILRQSYDGLEYKGLLDAVNEASDYLALIFHLFITKHGLTIAVNDTEIEPIDPFLEKHHKTEVGKTSDLTIKDKNGIDQHILVTPYLIPYLKDLSESDIKMLGGSKKLLSMQGFYVYRNERLIIYGTWFRMACRNELAKYARIRVDIPSSLDDIWKIDIKKQSAELPPIIRRQLEKCVDSVQFSSKRKNQHRLTLVADDANSVWCKNQDRDHKAVYRINRDSALVRTVFQQCNSSEEIQRLNLLLMAIERSIPFHDMYTDEANNNVSSTLSEEEKNEISLQGAGMVRRMQSITGGSLDGALSKVLQMQPFAQFDWAGDYIRKELNHD